MTFYHFIILLLIGLLVLCLAVSVSDFKCRRIPNKFLIAGLLYMALIYVAMLFVGVPFSFVGKGLLMGLLGGILGGLFLYPPYMLKQVGAGDVKLMFVFGLFLGPKGAILTILIGAMIGGVWALILAWKHGGLKHMWYNMKFMAKSAYLSGFKDMGWDLKSEGAIAMPYGVALCAGAAIIGLEQMQLYYTRIIEVTGG